MIGPLFLRGDLIHKFSKHLLGVPYFHVVHNGNNCLDDSSMNRTIDHANVIINNFTTSSFPIICFAGSKSSNPFFDYHIALNYCSDKRHLYIHELLVREPIQENIIKGILMASYVLINKEVGIEAIRIPFIISDYLNVIGIEDVIIEFDVNNNETYLYLRE